MLQQSIIYIIVIAHMYPIQFRLKSEKKKIANEKK